MNTLNPEIERVVVLALHQAGPGFGFTVAAMVGLIADGADNDHGLFKQVRDALDKAVLDGHATAEMDGMLLFYYPTGDTT